MTTETIRDALLRLGVPLDTLFKYWMQSELVGLEEEDGDEPPSTVHPWDKELERWFRSIGKYPGGVFERSQMAEVSVAVDLSSARAGKVKDVWLWSTDEAGRIVPSSHGWSAPVLIAPLGKCWLWVDGRPADFEDKEAARSFTIAATKWLREEADALTVRPEATLRFLWLEVPAKLMPDGVQPLPHEGSPELYRA